VPSTLKRVAALFVGSLVIELGLVWWFITRSPFEMGFIEIGQWVVIINAVAVAHLWVNDRI
jgi:hypothetical protein